MSSPNRIVIVADNPESTASFRASLASQPDLSFAAAVTCASCSFAAVSQQRPALVLIDLKLQEHRLLELARDLTVLHPRLKILLVSRHGQELESDRVLRSGAHGCISTGSSVTSHLAAVRQVLRGTPFFPPQNTAHPEAAAASLCQAALALN
ncbi:response regulator [Prosthecobacter vanneervenii]|uniref:DNA-binding NarL/FixJ family response regulator n=1 Tax=Prosthecobacter vanneervenii TaxID=48466 RepID=A0A7W8DKD4_9BACT|nr:response regulator [Prosthecobacter vanneervenii]MBB5033093.1 DNA-binding NarL/FixJ family response regulator [Prosthecobacter vanneervenii]